MSLRRRFANTAGFVLVGILSFSLVGVIFSSTSVAASGKVSAHLTKTTFAVVQAGNVKLVCAFSPVSTRFYYTLSLKHGATWTIIRSVKKMGHFKGSYTMTVKQLFGSNAVKIGQYHVNVIADANNVTKSFIVVNPSLGGSSTIIPSAGHWIGSTTESNFPTSPVEFYATPDQLYVANFNFSYNLYKTLPSFPFSCFTNGKSTQGAPTLIATNSFSASGTFYFSGTFDSPSSAHGTTGVDGIAGCSGTASSGPQRWAAIWKDASQPAP